MALPSTGSCGRLSAGEGMEGVQCGDVSGAVCGRSPPAVGGRCHIRCTARDDSGPAASRPCGSATCEKNDGDSRDEKTEAGDAEESGVPPLLPRRLRPLRR